MFVALFRMADSITRRHFLEGATLGGLCWAVPGPLPAAPFPVHFRRTFPHESLFSLVEPGRDEFACEKQAAEITSLLDRLPQTRALPLAPGFQGISPAPARYRAVAGDVRTAEFDPADRRFAEGLAKWLDSLGHIRAARFFVLPNDRVRYEISSSGPRGLEYRVGFWKQSWSGGRLAHFEPLEETVVSSERALFQDVTAPVFGHTESFDRQLRRGVPFWRARLDSACGIDVYGWSLSTWRAFVFFQRTIKCGETEE